MRRYIDADEFDERVRVAGGFADEELTDDFKDGVMTVLDMLKTQPTADVRETVHGEWIYVRYYEDGYNFWQCKRCDMVVMLVDTPSEEEFNYCPRCGADMRGEK